MGKFVQMKKGFDRGAELDLVLCAPREALDNIALHRTLFFAVFWA